MERILKFSPDTLPCGMRIDSFLRTRGFSGSVLNILRRDMGLVMLGGEGKRLVDTITPEKELVIRLPESEPPTDTAPEDILLSVIYEDEDILIINKSSDMAVYPTPATPDGTLAAACRYYFRDDETYVFRCITRLDRHTSGLILIAKNKLASCILTDSLHTRSLERTYLAAVQGLAPEAGTIDAPIARDENSPLARIVSDKGAAAVTHYKRLAYENGLSLMEVLLDTGRTHQIRVHFKHIGHPLPGDFLYNPDLSVISRPALHSWKLEFVHPITNEKMSFTAPPPDDIAKLFSIIP